MLVDLGQGNPAKRCFT